MERSRYRQVQRSLAWDAFTHGGLFSPFKINQHLSPAELLTKATEFADTGDVLKAAVVAKKILTGPSGRGDAALDRVTEVMSTAFANEAHTLAQRAQHLNERRGLQWIVGQPEAADLEVDSDRSYRRAHRWQILHSNSQSH